MTIIIDCGCERREAAILVAAFSASIPTLRPLVPILHVMEFVLALSKYYSSQTTLITKLDIPTDELNQATITPIRDGPR
jgi:hypothetical protein